MIQKLPVVLLVVLMHASFAEASVSVTPVGSFNYSNVEAKVASPGVTSSNQGISSFGYGLLFGLDLFGPVQFETGVILTPYVFDSRITSPVALNIRGIYNYGSIPLLLRLKLSSFLSLGLGTTYSRKALDSESIDLDTNQSSFSSSALPEIWSLTGSLGINFPLSPVASIVVDLRYSHCLNNLNRLPETPGDSTYFHLGSALLGVRLIL